MKYLNYMKYIKYFEAFVIISDKSFKNDGNLNRNQVRTLDSLYPYEKEILKRFKFKIGDYVKIRVQNEKDKFFKIMAVDTNSVKVVGGDYNYYLYNLDNTIYGWSTEPFLDEVEDWELAANLYNL